jgi:hypothetical protein
MSVFLRPSFDSNGQISEAILAEHLPPDDSDEELVLYRQRHANRIAFTLVITRGSIETAFHELSPSDLRHLGEQLIRLSEEG